MKKKPLEEQVIVITGASSGIGLATARLAAERGARVMLSARSSEQLARIAESLDRYGEKVRWVEADVRKFGDMQNLAREAIKHFGGFDTWINNAGVSIYGAITKVPIEDQRSLFETDYWGVVHGSIAAVPQLREREGTLINIGSSLSDRAIPLQGIYSAAKHAVKGFTDALRMELEAEAAGVSVCLIKPGAINTPYSEHAKNFLQQEPQNPPPVYATEVAAEAILHCAVHPRRDLAVGSGGRMLGLLAAAPRVADYLMEKSMFRLQHSDRPAKAARNEGLSGASGEGRESGQTKWPVRQSSFYTRTVTHPYASGAAAVAAGLLVRELVKRRGESGTNGNGQRHTL